MKITDDRYAGERHQFELALRMIRHEARTRTVRECTGLSDDRIRKLYGTYFGGAKSHRIRRHRGKSPRQIGRFVKNAANQLEATTLVSLYCCERLLTIDSDRQVHPRWPRPDVEYGHRVCRAFETYRLLHTQAQLNFEWAWNLLRSISHNDELYLAACADCGMAYVQDTYALDHKMCPSCEIAGRRQRRPGTAGFRPQ